LGVSLPVAFGATLKSLALRADPLTTTQLILAPGLWHIFDRIKAFKLLEELSGTLVTHDIADPYGFYLYEISQCLPRSIKRLNGAFVGPLVQKMTGDACRNRIDMLCAHLPHLESITLPSGRLEGDIGTWATGLIDSLAASPTPKRVLSLILTARVAASDGTVDPLPLSVMQIITAHGGMAAVHSVVNCREFDISALSLDYSSPLYATNLDVLDYLVNMCVNSKRTDIITNTLKHPTVSLLHHAVSLGASVDTLRKIVEAGIDVNTRSTHTRRTPLMIAASQQTATIESIGSCTIFLPWFCDF
jgi:hypothetical protein